MKNQIITFLVTALLASISFAQNASTVKAVAENEPSSKGLRISILKSFLEADVKASYQGHSFSGTDKLDDTLGFSLGYANILVGELGWTANLAYMDIKNEGTSVAMVRADGNLAYAFTSILNIKGGVNLSKFTSGTNYDKYNVGIGYQGGLGIQLTKNFGLDIGYTQMNQSGSSNGIDVDVKESGTEIGLNGTF